MKIITAFCLSLFGTVAALGQTPAAETAAAQTEDAGRTALARSLNNALRQQLGYPALPVAALDGAAKPDPQSGRRPPTLVDQPPPTAPLTLEEVLSLVESYHPKLRGADAQRRSAAAKRLEKQGAFDPVFVTGTDYLRFNTEFDSKAQRGKLANMRLADAGVEFLTRSGLKVAAGTRFNLGKVKAPLSPTGNGGEYFLEFKLPLLRGFRINEKTAAERQAFLGEPLADAEYQQTRLELLLKAASDYWDWVAAKRKLDVGRELLKLAEVRAQAVRDRVTAGDLPQIDAVEADLEVQRRQGSLVKADRDLQKAAFKLSLFLWSANGLPAPVPPAASVPPTTAPPVVFNDDRALAGQRLALERRPELKMLALNRDLTQVDLALAKNQRQPALDFAISPGRDTGFGAIGNTLKAGVSFTLPLRQRTADGRIGQANLKLEKLALDLVNERQRITTEVFDALSAINTAYERYRAALQEVGLAERLAEGERTRFTLGDGTLFLVNQRERTTAEARVKLIEVQAEYEQAVATFRAVTAQF